MFPAFKAEVQGPNVDGFVTVSGFTANPEIPRLQGYLTCQKTPTTEDHHMALGIALLKGPRGGAFLMGEVPLYIHSKLRTRAVPWGVLGSALAATVHRICEDKV